MATAPRFEPTLFGRRTFLKGTSAAAGALTSLTAFARLVTEAYGQEVPIPPEARNVEVGLAAFVAKWQVAGPAILLTRFGRFLSNKIFNCHVVGEVPRHYHLVLGAAGATLNPAANPFAHANLALSDADWKGILYGDFTGLAPLLAGRAFPSRDEANRAVLLAIVMYVFAHIPAGADNDPQLLLSAMQRLFANRGIPSCEGEPETLEVVADLENDRDGAVGEAIFGVNHVSNVSETLASWVHGLTYDAVRAVDDAQTDEAKRQIHAAKNQIKSILGVAYAGLTMDPGRKLVQAVASFGDAPEATVIGGSANRFRTSARSAAMANSFLAQILEWEDWTFLTHSGASIVPVVLAAGEVGQASGKEVLAAIVAGNEILARAGEFLTDVIHTGNAQAVHQLELPLLAGRLLGLDAKQMQDALGIACTQPQVTSIPAWTADAKGMLTGAPAYTAILAAQLAKKGISGRRDLLENPLGYFYRVADIATPRWVEKVVQELGSKWRFADEHFNKRYPTDGFQLPAVHAVLGARAKMLDPATGIIAADIPTIVRRIFARIPLVMAASATMFNEGKKDVADVTHILNRILDPDQPDWTYIALLFDGPYPLAAALLDGELTHRQYATSKILEIKNDGLYGKVEMVPDLSMGVFGAEVTIETTDGRSFTHGTDCIREDVNAGFSANDKFDKAAEDYLTDPGERQAILDAIDDLELVTDINDFTAIL